eukprot:14512486-Heterocapsa_arctica.AAC.1
MRAPTPAQSSTLASLSRAPTLAWSIPGGNQRVVKGWSFVLCGHAMRTKGGGTRGSDRGGIESCVEMSLLVNAG